MVASVVDALCFSAAVLATELTRRCLRAPRSVRDKAPRVRPRRTGAVLEEEQLQELRALVTIITSTSPTPSNPSMDLLASTIDSIALHAPELERCRNILVCDGYRLSKSSQDSKYRSGIVTEGRAKAYAEYIRAVEEEIASPDAAPAWKSMEVLKLEKRVGFGFAVKAALQAVTTPFVLVIQHDRTFMRPFGCARALLRHMEADPRLKMVGLPTRSNCPAKYPTVAASRLRRIGVKDCSIEGRILEGPAGLRFLPLLQWHDSTHFARTDYYRTFVFRESAPRLVSKGGFIEDRLGQEQIRELGLRGWESHAQYGTWLLDDGTPERMVGHMDGKRYRKDQLLRGGSSGDTE